MNTESIARVCHEANRAYCLGIGDDSQPSWDDAPQWQKDSAIAGVEAFQKDPDRLPHESHEGWLAHKRADGWTYGPVKDATTKQHPCMVPYGELSNEQRVKDAVFGVIARTLVLASREPVSA